MNDIHEKPAIFLKRNRRSGWKRDGGGQLGKEEGELHSGYKNQSNNNNNSKNNKEDEPTLA